MPSAAVSVRPPPVCADRRAAGICAATSASACRDSRLSIIRSTIGLRVAGELDDRSERHPGHLSIFGGGIGYEFNNWLRFDVTGEYRTKAEFKAIGSYTNFSRRRHLFDTNTAATLSVGGVPRQRLCRSRHLVVPHAVYRRRRRRRLQPHHRRAGQRHQFGRHGRLRLHRKQFGPVEFCLERCRPASPTTSPIISRWISATATCTWARR